MTLVRVLRAVVVAAALASVAPAETGARDAEAGAVIYGDYCSNSHGDELRNVTGGVTFDLRRLRPDDHDRFVNFVLDGKRQMPAWRGALEPDQIEAIWSYIRAKVDQR